MTHALNSHRIIVQLRNFLQAHDMSYQHLSDRMADALDGKTRSPDCLRKIHLGITEHPNDRTLFVIKQYLDHYRKHEKELLESVHRPRQPAPRKAATA